MSRASPYQANFTAGELSPRLLSRSDIEKYRNGVRRLENMVVMPHGGATKRPGTYFVAETKGINNTRLLPFRYSTVANYIIELGALYFRFYKNRAQILNLGTPIELAHPYSESEIPEVKFAQSVDTMYLFHRNHPVQKLTRASDISWSIVDAEFIDGPYLDENTESTHFLTPSATSGSVTITATGVGNTPFAATDVGRFVRIKNATNWGYAIITAFTSTTQVTATVNRAFDSVNPTIEWALGAFSETTGYPSCGTFYEQRLWMGGTTLQPQTIFASKTGDYANMMSTEANDTVLDDSALVYTLATDSVNDVRHMVPGIVLQILTSTAEFTVSASSLNEAITPTNVKIKPETTRGANNVRPVKIDADTFFWQASSRKIRDFRYSFEIDSHVATDATILSEHISLTGIVDMAYQQEPNSILWSVRADGQLIGMTYEKDQAVLAWHRHFLGGGGLVRAVACIPGPDDEVDDTWLVVERTINGGTVKYIEYITPEVTPVDENDKSNFVFMDSALSYDGPPATVFTGADHLEGEEVVILADGAVQPSQTITAGGFTLAKARSKVHIGLGYASLIQTLNPDEGGNEGTAQTKPGRIHKLGIKFWNTLGAKYGPSLDKLIEVQFRRTSDPMDSSPPLFTGDKIQQFAGTYETDRTLFIVSDQPYPMTVIGLVPNTVING